MVGPLSYIGGKNRVAKRVIAMLPEHLTYVEPFAGGAQVFFHKAPSAVEILNGLDGEVVNFFRICQLHYEELLRYLRFTLASRDWFALYELTPPASLTDVQRAARFFYLQKNAYAGLVARRNFKLCVEKTPNFNPGRLAAVIEKAHERLQKVQIENRPYDEVIERCDRPTTLFYLDPPYWERKLYNFNFDEEDFVKMKKVLEAVKGKFVLSLNDLPAVRKLFSEFRFTEFEMAYSSQKMAGKRFKELLITNF